MNLAASHDSRSADGLDEAIWQHLAAIATAASRGQVEEFLRRWEALQAQVAQPKRRRWAAVYVSYLIEYRVIQILGRKPTVRDLKDIASEADAQYTQIIKAGKASLYDTLCTIFELASPDKQITGPEFSVAGSAAIGTLFSNPAQQLPAIRPHLAAWCSRYADSLSEMGLG